MKRYGVTVPLTGAIYMEVEAATPEAAISEALCVAFTAEFSSDDHPELEVSEVDVMERIVQGNVCYAPVWEAEAEELDEDEEE